MMTRTLTNLFTLGVLAGMVACAGTSRGLEAYRTDTSSLLGTRSAQVKACYDDALKTDANLAGMVTVQFIVEKQTGVVAHAAVALDQTSAPPALGQCVVKALDGLVLAPPDRNEGRATFVYDFKPSPAPAS